MAKPIDEIIESCAMYADLEFVEKRILEQKDYMHGLTHRRKANQKNHVWFMQNYKSAELRLSFFEQIRDFLVENQSTKQKPNDHRN